MAEALKSIHEMYDEARERFACEHSALELRRRVVEGGGIQYVEQCIRCGEARSQPLARVKALARCGGNEPQPFDDTLLKQWKEAKSAAYEAISEVALQHKAAQAVDAAAYRSYLASESWAKKRQLVLLRAQGICEGCRSANATVVHHLTYEHIFHEFLFELVALCGPCHDRIHNGSNVAN